MMRYIDRVIAIPKTKLTPTRAMLFAKISVALTCAWPPPSLETTKVSVNLIYNIWWYTCYLSSVLLLLPLLNSVYEYRNDPVILAKSVCLSCAVVQVTIKMMMCRSRYTRFQAVYREMETFCKQADEKTNVSLQRYVDSYKRGYGIFILWCYLTAIGVICGPLILPEQFPTPAKYPFSVERQSVKVVIYLHQSLVGLQAASGMCIDCVIAILLFYSAARLELLAQKIRGTKNERDLDRCIELHDEILNSEKDQPTIVKAQYVVVVFCASLELLMCALPADNLMHVSWEICSAAYELQWCNGSMSMRRKIVQILLRSQKPVVIRINGVVSALSLNYYARFLYTSGSYFTAVRVMVSGNVMD
ncbi:uncharacterized protein LOC109857575 [Pseudomyrmex gracilis]|uniref:uncharacterized protein LOC109857575 n=1 Tax=Pseudomyrmex gracilis TaxID=219809 RepID=UPI00099490F8|nr:uncharacterized protein LOC109857575 [Pseudomyrmex gracilis]